MGVVYEAVQISLGRRAALKVLPFARAPTPNNANVSCKGREQKARLDKFSFRFEISG